MLYQLFKYSWDRRVFLTGFFTSKAISMREVGSLPAAASKKADIRVGVNQQQAGIGQKRKRCKCFLPKKEEKLMQVTSENYLLTFCISNLYLTSRQ